MFDALIPENEITVEHDFVAWLLSIDGLRHPLLRNLPVILPPPPEIYALTAEEFPSLREALLIGKPTSTSIFYTISFHVYGHRRAG